MPASDISGNDDWLLSNKYQSLPIYLAKTTSHHQSTPCAYKSRYLFLLHCPLCSLLLKHSPEQNYRRCRAHHYFKHHRHKLFAVLSQGQGI